MVNIKAFVFNPFRENTYFVWDEEGSLVVIDPSFYDQEEQEAFFSLVSRENLTLCCAPAMSGSRVRIKRRIVFFIIMQN